MVVASGHAPSVVETVFAGADIGTLFVANGEAGMRTDATESQASEDQARAARQAARDLQVGPTLAFASLAVAHHSVSDPGAAGADIGGTERCDACRSAGAGRA